jgi:CheY-like chemotaxis protein
MSHELRTPLNAVLGFGQLMQMGELSDEHREYTETILSAAHHLLALMDDVMNISRIEQGNLSFSIEPIPFVDLVNEAAEFIKPAAAARGINVRVEIDRNAARYVLADGQRLRQVLTNLLSNAVKYNTEHGSITLEVRPLSEGVMRFAVSDTGPGIDQAAIEKLFVPFERLDAQQRGIEGTGLGLVVSRQFVEAMGGTMSVASTVGEGTTFVVDLHAVEPAVVHAVTTEHVVSLDAYSYGAPKRIFYVEDVIANIRLVEKILSKRPDVTVVPIMLGDVALERSRREHPDLILLDLHLPDIDGDEVLQRLKADETTRDIPVVVVSADATQRHTDQLIAAGATAYLTKPISVRRLLETIDRVIEGHVTPRR